MSRFSHFLFKSLVFASVFFPASAYGQLVINEFLALNTSLNPDPDFMNYSDWVEIYNGTDSSINLSGYSLTDNFSDPLKWIIPSGNEIKADSYQVIWMDGRNSGLHASFKLDGSGEQIGLFRQDGTVIDTITYARQYSNISFGREFGTGYWYYFPVPTPGSQNDTLFYTGVAPQPVFSVPGGFYSAPVTLEMSSPAVNGIIRYTIDGAEPDSGSLMYTSPLIINESTVIRIRIFIPGELPGKTINQTYFIGEPGHDLPVLSISLDPSDLWDTLTGIYINYNEEWEKPCGFEYYNAEGGKEFSLNAGIRIFGGTSRARPQKSFAIHMRDKYGDGPIRFPLLPGRKDTRLYKSFILRNSANDWSGSWRGTLFRDALIHTLVESQMDVDYQSYQPAVIYLNGEYWGILNIRDKHNEDYCEVHYDVNRDSVDIIKHNEAVAGDSMPYHDMMAFFENNDLYSDDLYQEATTMVDIQEFINYMIAEVYSCNIDWPGNNYRLWRPKDPPGKWRWMMFDTEFGFNGFQWAPVTTNMLINKALNPDMDDYVNKGEKAPWATRVFIKLTQNQQFVNRFVSSYLSHIYTTYDPIRVDRIVDSLKNNLMMEMPRHIERWSDVGGIVSMPEWEKNIQGMKDFGHQRPNFALRYLRQTFGLEDSAEVSLTLEADNGRILLNGITLDRDSFSGNYYIGLPVDLDVIPDYGYVFKEWRVTGTGGEEEPDTMNEQQTTLILTGDITVEAIMEGVNESIPLKINELMAGNTYTLLDNYEETDDWIEILNTGTEAIDLGGMYLTDSLDDPTSWMIPDSNNDSTLLQPGEFMILWADGETWQGVLHLGFKLSSDGEQVGLFTEIGEHLYLIDSVSFPPLLADYSLARYPDGSGPWEIFNVATPGLNNYYLGQEERRAPDMQDISIFPNPTGGMFSIAFGQPDYFNLKQEVNVTIYNHTGQLVLSKMINKGPVIEVDLSACSPGIYYVRINTSQSIFSGKVILIR